LQGSIPPAPARSNVLNSLPAFQPFCRPTRRLPVGAFDITEFCVSNLCGVVSQPGAHSCAPARSGGRGKRNFHRSRSLISPRDQTNSCPWSISSQAKVGNFINPEMPQRFRDDRNAKSCGDEVQCRVKLRSFLTQARMTARTLPCRDDGVRQSGAGAPMIENEGFFRQLTEFGRLPHRQAMCLRNWEGNRFNIQSLDAGPGEAAASLHRGIGLKSRTCGGSIPASHFVFDDEEALTKGNL
jgi:hypothetical protein